MVNTEEFTKRLHQVMDYYDLSAAAFADKIDVGRSSISHLLSGRNKPSLDFVMKIVHSFPEVELYWLLNGKGSFPKRKTNEESPAKTSESSTLADIEEKDLQRNSPPAPEGETKRISRIVIFYEDGSFDAFQN